MGISKNYIKEFDNNYNFVNEPNSPLYSVVANRVLPTEYTFTFIIKQKLHQCRIRASDAIPL
ncbi:MAG TPA: hypothetical protein PKW74_05885, partial [Ruminococcus bromii]|nr:hypothetical protein [Ruminococcus bromii]